MSSVDECHQHHHALEPTPPLPTQLSALTMPSALVMMAMPATPTKAGAMLMNHIGIGHIKKWGVRTSSMPSEVVGGFFFSCYSFFLPVIF